MVRFRGGAGGNGRPSPGPARRSPLCDRPPGRPGLSSPPYVVPPPRDGSGSTGVRPVERDRAEGGDLPGREPVPRTGPPVDGSCGPLRCRSPSGPGSSGSAPPPAHRPRPSSYLDQAGRPAPQMHASEPARPGRRTAPPTPERCPVHGRRPHPTHPPGVAFPSASTTPWWARAWYGWPSTDRPGGP